MPEKKTTEIRSRAVREILSNKPHLVLRFASAGILILLCLFIGLSWFVPYPAVVVSKITIQKDGKGSSAQKYSGEIDIPLRQISSVKVGQQVNVRIEGIPNEIEGTIEAIDEELKTKGPQNRPYYRSKIRLTKPLANERNLAASNAPLQGDARIITEDLRLFERIFGKIQKVIFN